MLFILCQLIIILSVIPCVYNHYMFLCIDIYILCVREASLLPKIHYSCAMMLEANN